jgi:hypothetical protein
MWERHGVIPMKNAACLLSCLLALSIVAGCQNAGFGERVNLPQEKRVSLLDDFAAGAPLRLPTDSAFNLTDSQRTSDGAGQAESTSDATGKARCSASSDTVGTAEAQFQLGQVLDNRGQGPLQVTARFEVAYKCRVTCDPDDISKTADHLGLRVFVRDSNGLVSHKLSLTDLSPFIGPKKWSGHQTQSFDVTLEPGLAYYFVLAGLTSVTGTEASAASAEIEVESLNIELTPRK